MTALINTIDLSSDLSSDYEKLYESNKYTDVSINVGKEPANKIFLAHAVVLCTRSTYFERVIAESTGDFQQTVMAFEDVTSETFELLLRFIYMGKVNFSPGEVIDWISLLDVSCRFELDKFVAAIGDHLINHQKEWMEHNLLAIHKCASSSNLSNLLDYCNNIIVSSPEIVFKSDSIMSLQKETLITLLKNDKLNMEEIDIWSSVVEWATNQVPGLVNEPSSWSPEDFSKVRPIVADCIPHIRFFNISSDDFQKQIAPYDELLTKSLRHDLMFYHLNKDYRPKFTVLAPRKRQATYNDLLNENVAHEEHKVDVNSDIDSVILNTQQAIWISQKIMESSQRGQRAYGRNNSFHKLTLLYRHSKDGGALENFRKMCAGKGPTVAVGKVGYTGEILGGYNPIAWKAAYGLLRYTPYPVWVSTTESFIFSLDKGKLENSIMRSVVNHEHAIKECSDYYPCFGNTDLFFGDGRTKMGACAKRDAYRTAIRFDSNNFGWVDWEVFLVTKIN